MKNARIFFLIPALIILVFLVRDIMVQKKSDSAPDASGQAVTQTEDQQLQPQDSQTVQATKKAAKFFSPLDRISERVTKKPFGIFITPQSSPVQPERFQGYHTGTDFETFSEEQNEDVPIYAMNDGKILMKRSASGYGGVLVESGIYNGSSITIIYGHLSLSSIDKKVGDSLIKGEQIGFLGKGYSSETDGERKHLHLGVYRGSEVSILGYVSAKEGLKNWIDPMALLSSESQ